jgi:hypothetical protein
MYVCYTDYSFLALMKEVRVSYGSQLIQRLERDQFFIYGQRMLRDEQLFHWQQMVLGGFSQAARVLNASQRQYGRAELSTLWVNQIESNALMVNAMSAKLAIEIDFEPSVNLIQQWGTCFFFSMWVRLTLSSSRPGGCHGHPRKCCWHRIARLDRCHLL